MSFLASKASKNIKQKKSHSFPAARNSALVCLMFNVKITYLKNAQTKQQHKRIGIKPLFANVVCGCTIESEIRIKNKRKKLDNLLGYFPTAKTNKNNRKKNSEQNTNRQSKTM